MPLPEGYVRPMSCQLHADVIDEESVLAEQRRAEMRVVREGFGEYARGAACPHEGDIRVHLQYRDLSDHETAYGQCVECNEWVRRTTWFGRRSKEEAVETDAMTAKERAAVATVMDCTNSEW